MNIDGRFEGKGSRIGIRGQVEGERQMKSWQEIGGRRKCGIEGDCTDKHTRCEQSMEILYK